MVGSAFGPSVVFPGIVEAQARAAWRHIILTWLVMMFALLLALDHDNRMMTQGRKGCHPYHGMSGKTAPDPRSHVVAEVCTCDLSRPTSYVG